MSVSLPQALALADSYGADGGSVTYFGDGDERNEMADALCRLAYEVRYLRDREENK